VSFSYTYFTSLANDNYKHYDQAVQDCYEMEGNEPSYGDWGLNLCLLFKEYEKSRFVIVGEWMKHIS